MAAAAAGKMDIVEHLISLPTCTAAQKINALELLGAALVDMHEDFEGAEVFWKRAMEER
jgi:hypothetical protein